MKRTYKGVEFTRVGISWYVSSFLAGKSVETCARFPLWQIAMSWAEAKRWLDEKTAAQKANDEAVAPVFARIARSAGF